MSPKSHSHWSSNVHTRGTSSSRLQVPSVAFQIGMGMRPEPVGTHPNLPRLWRGNPIWLGTGMGINTRPDQCGSYHASELTLVLFWPYLFCSWLELRSDPTSIASVCHLNVVVWLSWAVFHCVQCLGLKVFGSVLLPESVWLCSTTCFFSGVCHAILFILMDHTCGFSSHRRSFRWCLLTQRWIIAVTSVLADDHFDDDLCWWWSFSISDALAWTLCPKRTDICVHSRPHWSWLFVSYVLASSLS